MIISVDCGSTNMRCRLFDGKKLVDEVRKKAGVRNTAFDGTNTYLKESLRDCIADLLRRNLLKSGDVEVVISAGTLSSDVGIYRVPHVKAPVGVFESAAHAKLVTLPEITDIPILFIPGVKTLPGNDVTDKMKQIEIWDSMSGEECEIYGISEMLGLKGPFTITLPGSYNKILRVDAEGKITTMITGMCGEFIAAMSEHTLLKKSLPQPVIREIIPEKLKQGFDFCAEHGVSPSLIKARMVRIHGGWSEDEAGNFFVGAILIDDIRSIARSCGENDTLVIGGGDPLRSIFKILIEHAEIPHKELKVVDDLSARLASNVGSIKVYELFKQLNK